jgi:hypothetical protein
VTTSSKFANVVTLVVTAVELVVAYVVVHVLPQYVDLPARAELLAAVL